MGVSLKMDAEGGEDCEGDHGPLLSKDESRLFFPIFTGSIRVAVLSVRENDFCG